MLNKKIPENSPICVLVKETKMNVYLRKEKLRYFNKKTTKKRTKIKNMVRITVTNLYCD